MQIDETDAKIIQALINDARTKLKDMADDCKISITAIKKRIDNLKKNKLVIKPALIPNIEFFGYPLTVLIGVNLEKNQEKHIIELIQKHTKVAGIDQTIGNYDLCLFVFAKSVNDLDKLKQIINRQKGVKTIEVNIWHKIHDNYNNINLQDK
jgi:Lrp/AsnC family transcriptional regulator, leucine-responsive regulatory protein